jgi:hypothetical protein
VLVGTEDEVALCGILIELLLGEIEDHLEEENRVCTSCDLSIHIRSDNFISIAFILFFMISRNSVYVPLRLKTHI